MSDLKVSVVIPAHNEAGIIGEVVAGCRHSIVEPCEVIVCDDGSSDDTAAVARHAGARVLRWKKNRGKGHALRTGAAAAVGEVIVFLDGDGQDCSSDLVHLVNAVDQGAELVIGSRFLGRPDPRGITPVNRVGNRLLTEMLNLLFGTRLSDSQAGYRAIRSSLWRRLGLRSNAYDVETEMLVRALQAGARVVEVPVSRGPRRFGHSAFHRVRDGARIVRRMVALRLRAGASSS